MSIDTRPLLKEHKSELDKTINKLIVGGSIEPICSRNKNFPNLRKIVYLLKMENNMPIETVACDCGYKYIHKAYYFEWALAIRRGK